MSQNNDEKLTPWDAPHQPKIKVQHTPTGPNPFAKGILSQIPNAGSPAPQGLIGQIQGVSIVRAKPTRWQRIKNYCSNWYKNGLGILPYVIIGGFEAVVLFTLPHGSGHAGPAFALGLNVGLAFLTLLHNQQKKMDKMLKESEIDIARMEGEIKGANKVHQAYEAKYGPL